MKNISKAQRKKDLELMNKITSKSKFTEKDIEELSEKIKSRTAKRFYEYCNKHNKIKCVSQ